MDEIADYNSKRWKALAEANALFTRPMTELNAEQAREMVDPHGDFGDLRGQHVLCLASGGGKQSVAFALLGAQVTVVDLSAEQLKRDQQMAEHHRLEFTILQADMRDLSALAAQHFDLVYHPYSINFIPEVMQVFAQVKRVIKAGGVYHFMCANPFAAGVRERDWNGSGYTVSKPYAPSARIEYQDEVWVYDRDQHGEVPPPVEYRHTLEQLTSGLSANGFFIQCIQEIMAYDASMDAEPGTWNHFTAVLPPWLTFLCKQI